MGKAHSESNSSQNRVSSHSSTTIQSFEKYSLVERALHAARKLAATEVPERNSCLPITCVSVDFDNPE